MSFAESLKKARESVNLTQKQLSDLSGVSQSAISAIELGIRSPSESTMKLLADALGYSVSDLMEPEQEEGEIQLTRDERLLITDYRNLNEQGKEYIRQTMYMARTIYKKCSDVSGVEELNQ